MDQEIDVPSYFLCPISLQIMKDPVTVSTGITYDRDSIERWIFSNNDNNPTCPLTKQCLNIDTDFLTPNHTLRRLIQSWCTLNAVERFPTPRPLPTKTQVVKIFNDALKCSRNRPVCLNKLKDIASESTANKRCLESFGAVEFLFRVIFLGGDDVDQAVSVLSQLNVSEEKIRSLLGQNQVGVCTLVDLLARVMNNGSYEGRAWAIEVMKSVMQVMNPDQMASLKRDHFGAVVQVLRDQVSSKMVKSALKVLSLACPWGRNRIKVVESGVVSVLVDLLLGSTHEDRRIVEMTFVVLDHLCRCAEGRSELVRHPAGLAVVSKKILRVSHIASESGVKILYLISKYLGTSNVVQEMLQIGVVAKLCLLMQMDCDYITKERATEILKLHNKAWRNSPCAPTQVLSSLS